MTVNADNLRRGSDRSSRRRSASFFKLLNKQHISEFPSPGAADHFGEDGICRSNTNPSVLGI
jgi:hypothetical protein